MKTNNKINNKVSFEFTDHKAWSKIYDNATLYYLFEAWYHTQTAREYNHIRHAFNSLCCHVGRIEFIQNVSQNDFMEIWRMDIGDKGSPKESWLFVKNKIQNFFVPVGVNKNGVLSF